MHIILHQPEIPANTGNIGRTCVATGTRLHLIEPMGFSVDEKSVKRAGLDYWQYLDVTVYKNFEEFLEKNPGAKIYMATTKGLNKYSDVKYDKDAYIMFGKESMVPIKLERPASNEIQLKLMILPRARELLFIGVTSKVAMVPRSFSPA